MRAAPSGALPLRISIICSASEVRFTRLHSAPAKSPPMTMPRPVVEVPEARHHVMLDQPLGFVAALRMLLDSWMRSESEVGSG
jgi:hypothetical protein